MASTLKSISLTLLLTLSLPLLLAFFGVTSNFSIHEAFVGVIPYVPSNILQNVGSWFLHFISAQLLPFAKSLGLFHPLECFEAFGEAREQRVIVAVNKGGSVLSGMLAWELVQACGISASLGIAVNDAWPPVPDLMPDYRSDLLLAVSNGENWVAHVQKYKIKPENLKCVVLTRNPFDRMFSLYKYTRDGGESGLLQFGRDLEKIEDPEKRLEFVWTQFGKESMEITHKVLTDALGSSKFQCEQIKIDDFFKGGKKFDEASLKLLKKFGVKAEVYQSLLDRFKKHDVSTLTKEQRDKNDHISGKSVSQEEKDVIKKLLHSKRDIFSVLSQQAKDLNY